MKHLRQCGGISDADLAATNGIMFVMGRAATSQEFRFLSETEGTISHESPGHVPDRFALFLPERGELYRDCRVIVRWDRDVDFDLGQLSWRNCGFVQREYPSGGAAIRTPNTVCQNK